MISVTLSYSGSLDDCSSSSPSPPLLPPPQKIQEQQICGLAINKEILLFRKYVNAVRLWAWLPSSNKESYPRLYFTLLGNVKQNIVHLFQLLLAENGEIYVFQRLDYSISLALLWKGWGCTYLGKDVIVPEQVNVLFFGFFFLLDEIHQTSTYWDLFEWPSLLLMADSWWYSSCCRESGAGRRNELLMSTCNKELSQGAEERNWKTQSSFLFCSTPHTGKNSLPFSESH